MNDELKETEISEMRDKLLEKEISEARNGLSTDRLDMSFGEILSMYEREEIIIDPDFQRLFRWKEEQQTKFIESLLLGIPIPPIFVAELPETGKWELVDGLQRVSTVLSFFGKLKTDTTKNDWILSEGGIIKEALQGYSCNTLPLKYQLNIRRAVCRMEIIKWNSKIDMRYELFNRLNSLGSQISPQELRNCIFRPKSNDYYKLLKRLAENSVFIELISPTEDQKEQLYLQELVLRFFALFHVAKSATKASDIIKENLSSYLTSYMRDEVSKTDFDVAPAERIFNKLLELITPLGKNVFRSLTGQGPFSPNIYDVVTVGIALNLDRYENMPSDDLKEKIDLAKQDDEFKDCIGSKANSKERVAKRVEFAQRFFSK
ncbi:MAG: DUF262 domain-containing protein [Candidatus Methylumidiphilus sp.]